MPPSTHIPDTLELVKSLGTALGLGLLVGLQREWVQNRVAGIRTFALLTLFGAMSGLLGLAVDSWVVVAALLAVAGLVVMGNLAEWKSREPDTGLTTEMAMLVMFAVGVISAYGQRLIAVVVAGSVMVLLQSKKPLHDMVRRIGEDDLREIARLVLAGLVILPVLPNRGMGYMNVLNPFAIWLMVVLIIGISLAAYLAGKFLGGGRGMAISGILGGMISSTATTASLARRSRAAESGGRRLSAIALIASGIVFVRVAIEVFLTAPGHLKVLLPPLLVMLVWFGAVAAAACFLARREAASAVDERPPSEMKSAVFFGLLYALVLVAVAAARQHFGNSGLYVAAALSGLTDVDAITLSTSRLVTTADLDPATGWRMILVGGMANVVFKMGLVAVLGARQFRRSTLAGFGVALLGGVALVSFWP
ncbi:MAG: MgtC/SapB family protein [Verrucomicrobiales bacterium]